MRCALLLLFLALVGSVDGGAAQIVTAVPLAAKPCYPGEQEGFPFKKNDSLYYGLYGGQWEALREGGLCKQVGSARQVFRFVWLPNAQPAVAVTIHDFGQRYVVQAKRLDGANGREPGELTADTTFELAWDDWTYVLHAVRQAGFYLKVVPQTLLGPGETRWFLEWSGNGSYHSIEQWTPPAGAFRTLGEWMLQQSGFLPDSIVTQY